MAENEKEKKKNKKINKLSDQEVSAKIEETATKMGGLSSKYAQELLKRKK